jgi:hypothetical protein
MNAADELGTMLADLAERVQRIRDFKCQHGYECRATRNPPKRTIVLAEHWRSEVAVRRATLSNRSVVATPPLLARVGSADTAGRSVEGSNECQPVQQ